MSSVTVRYEDGRIYLDNGVSVALISRDYCPKCKQMSENNQFCYDCKHNYYSFDSVLAFGYYIGRWYKLPDAFIVPEEKHWTQYLLEETNPIYMFCKLINDAKKRNTVKTIREKKNIINTLCKGFAWKLKRYDNLIINTIDFLACLIKFEIKT